MIKFYSSILEPDECFQIASQMRFFSAESKNKLENAEYIGNSEGFYNLSAALTFLPKIEKIIKNDYGENITFENNYTRIYKNKSYLKCHTDRPGLDITLSICVYCDAGINWPLCVSKKSINTLWDNKYAIDHINNYDQYLTPVGSGVACLGTKNPHWRDPLVCNDNEIMIQAFFHWKILN